MPKHCDTCVHPERDEIDRRLLLGHSGRVLGEEFGISQESIQRHKMTHLPATMVKAHDDDEVLRADGLLANVTKLWNDAQRLGAAAEADGDRKTALLGVRESVRCLDLMFRAVSWSEDRSLTMAQRADVVNRLVLETLKERLAGTDEGRELLLTLADDLERRVQRLAGRVTAGPGRAEANGASLVPRPGSDEDR